MCVLVLLEHGLVRLQGRVQGVGGFALGRGDDEVTDHAWRLHPFAEVPDRVRVGPILLRVVQDLILERLHLRHLIMTGVWRQCAADTGWPRTLN